MTLVAHHTLDCMCGVPCCCCCCCCCCWQDGDFHIARISVQEDVAKQMTDNDLLLLTKDHPQDEKCRCTHTGTADPHHLPSPATLGSPCAAVVAETRS
jgi:hypothetical protein